ncbi:hypothetical protein T484DRAFT_1836813, partial [Baffinella frigidus]
LSALHFAALSERADIANVVLDAGAHPDAPSGSENATFHPVALVNGRVTGHADAEANCPR